jgi:hypothetical protein
MSDQRARVAERAQACCEYCRSQERFSPDSFSVEHIIPLARGGKDSFANLAFACQGCNNRKYTSVEAFDAISQMVVPLFNPRKHKWTEHFAWSADGSLILGLTPVGRVTVEKLQLNRAGLVNLRRVLSEAGEHPPAP